MDRKLEKLTLLAGSDGLVGSRFVEISEHRENLHTPKAIEFDITNAKQVGAILNSYDFSVIINFAANTDVNTAENERGNKKGDVWQTNVEGPKNLAHAIKESDKDIHFIQISTDMVFPGNQKNKGPYSEDTTLSEKGDDLTWYGYTKLEGENEVRGILGDRATILRLIYPVRAKYSEKLDYLRKPLKMYDEGKLYPLFSDQIVSISFIDEVVMAIDTIIKNKKFGTFHASSCDTGSPHEIISYLIEKTRGKSKALESVKIQEFIKSQNFPSYRYPQYGGLKVEKTEKELGIKFKTWKEIIDELVIQGVGEA